MSIDFCQSFCDILSCHLRAFITCPSLNPLFLKSGILLENKCLGMYDAGYVTMTTYLSLRVVEYLWHVRWIVRYHDYIPEFGCSTVEYLWHLRWIGRDHDYITEFGSSRVFMTCTMDWTYGYHDYIFEFGISRVFVVSTMDWTLS